MAWAVALLSHVFMLVLLISLVRRALPWEEMRVLEEVDSGGGGGGRTFLIPLSSPPRTAVRPPPVVERRTPPVRVPVVAPPILPPVETPPPQPVDTVVHAPAADSAGQTGTGGGTGGGSGTGTGPGTGAGSGPGKGGGTGGGTGPGTLARGPEPRQMILPPFDYPKSMRGMTIQVTFVVESDGRVADVVFVPEVPDGGYAKKLETVMKSYRFRPARSAEGLPVRGATTVHITF